MKNNCSIIKYILCPFCTHNFGKATEIDRFQPICPACGEELDVYVTKYGVRVERHKKAS